MRCSRMLRSLVIVTVLAVLSLGIAGPAFSAPDPGNGQPQQPTPQQPGSGPAQPTPLGNGGDQKPSPDAGHTDDNSLAQNVVNWIVEISLRSLASWIGQGASWASMHMVKQFNTKLSPKVNGSAIDGDWFALQYQMMMNIGFWVMIPLVLMAIIHAIAQGSMATLVRIMVLYLPMSIIGTAFAVSVVQALLDITDDASNLFLQMTYEDMSLYFQKMQTSLARGALLALLDIIVGLLVMASAIGIMVVLAVRDASVYLATMFLPVGFAMFVWPAMAKHLKRVIEFLIGVIFSKLVMVACLSLGIAALNGAAAAKVVDGNMAMRDATDVSAATGEPVFSSAYADFMGYGIPGAAILLITFMAPHLAMRLAGNIGLGETAGVVADAFGRNGLIMQYILIDRMRNNARALFGNPDGDNSPRSIRYAAREFRKSWQENRNTSTEERYLKRLGIYPNADGSYGVSSEELTARGIAPEKQAQILRCWDPQTNVASATLVAAGVSAAEMGSNFKEIEELPGGVAVRGEDGKSTIIGDFDRRAVRGRNYAGKYMRYDTARDARAAVMNEAQHQIDTYGTIQQVNYVYPTLVLESDPINRTNTIREGRVGEALDKAVNRARRTYGSYGGSEKIVAVHSLAASRTAHTQDKIDQAKPTPPLSPPESDSPKNLLARRRILSRKRAPYQQRKVQLY